MKAFLLGALFALTPLALHAAQFDDVLLTARPEAPRPGERVTVTATLLGADTAGTVFTWLVNDEQVARGVGNNTLAVDAPKLGSTLSVRVLINGEDRSAPLTLRPAEVSLEWEGLTVSPPFYIGRPLMGGQGSVRILAVPNLVTTNGSAVPPQDINYSWRVNGSVLQKQSGYGVQSVVIKPPFYDDPFTVSVSAESRSGLRAVQSQTFLVASPDVVVYEISPLGGLLDTLAVTRDFQFTANEVTFMAYPLNTSQPANLEYQWTLSDTPIALNTGDPRLAVFRKTGSGTGAYTVGLNITSQTAFLDLVRKTFLLHF